MKGIFAPETATDFTWQTWFTLRGHKMHVYAYHVAAGKSDYHVVVPEQSKDLVTAYHGLIFIDDRKHFVHRITLHADGIPPAFPIQDISLMLDYEYTRIGDADYLLPLTFELRSREGNVPIKNDVDYDQYRKFTADSSLNFTRLRPRRKVAPGHGPDLNERRGLDARNLKLLPASHVLAHHLVIQQDHVAGGLLEFRAVALVGMARQPVHFGPHQPAQIVSLRSPAEGAVQSRRLLGFGFFVKSSFVHNYFRSYATMRR